MLGGHDDAAAKRMTYSIVALDPVSGEVGLAVQTAWPGVGASVPWVESGVGAVATQAFTNVDLGPLGLTLLRSGLRAPDVLREILAADPERETRQVGLIDAAGRMAAHTGRGCVAEAGHACQAGAIAMGNMLERPDVPGAMLAAFHAAGGDLAERLMMTLRAAERAGGDIRGARSAALVVAPGPPIAQAWALRFDLRVDASPQPLEELERLLRLARAYEALSGALTATEAHDLELALEGTALAYGLAPEDPQVAFWHAMTLRASQRSEEARLVLGAALRTEPRLAEFGRRFAESGHRPLLEQALRGSRPPDR